MRSGLLDRAGDRCSPTSRGSISARRGVAPPDRDLPVRRDWEKAIENASRFRGSHHASRWASSSPSSNASSPRQRRRATPRPRAFGRAYAADPTSVRAGIAEGRLEPRAGRRAAAIRAFERAARHDPDYLPDILPMLQEATRRSANPAAPRLPSPKCEHYRGIAPVLALRMVEAEGRGRGPAVPRPTPEGSPSRARRGGADRPDPRRRPTRRRPCTTSNASPTSCSCVTRATAATVAGSARSRHWQCPAAKEWGTVKPLLNYMRWSEPAGLLAIGLLAWLVSWAGARWAIRHAQVHGLHGLPGERRSRAVPTPRGGGIGIAAASLAALLCLLRPTTRRPPGWRWRRGCRWSPALAGGTIT